MMGVVTKAKSVTVWYMPDPKKTNKFKERSEMICLQNTLYFLDALKTKSLNTNSQFYKVSGGHSNNHFNNWIIVNQCHNYLLIHKDLGLFSFK